MPLAIVPEGFELTPPHINSGDEDEDDDFEQVLEQQPLDGNVPNNKETESFGDDMDAWQ